MKRHLALSLATTLLGLAVPTLLPATAHAQERPSTILVLDASGSMWGQIDGVNKITIARDVVSDILTNFPADQNLGLVAYGHRERGQCSDIETLVPPAPNTAAQIVDIVNKLNPRGMTPMMDAVVSAAEALRYTEQKANVILISDGIETCNADPCAAAGALAEAGVDFTTHVIGFDVRGEADALAQMQCIAEATGGRFLTADNAEELSAALEQVVVAPAEAPEPEPEPEPELPDATVSAPKQVLVGSEFVVTWEGEGLKPEDYVTIVPAGTEEGKYSNYDRLQARNEGKLRAPAEAGLYEVRLQLDSNGRVAASTPIEVIDAEVSVSAPEQVIVGSEFEVTWTAEGLHPRDYVTIVPAGTEEGKYTNYHLLQGGDKGKLRAPAEAGLYEVRLQLDQGGRVLATTPIEVIDADVSVSAPQQVLVGSEFEVTWSAEGLDARDYVTIVPAGTEEGKYTNYHLLQGGDKGKLRAPTEAGLYEVRLQLDQGGRVLASTSVEVLEGEVTVAGPEQVRAGAEIALSWTGTIHPRDYITIVPAGAEDGTYKDYLYVGSASTGKLRAPEEQGLYEIRYQLDQGNRVMARQALEVVAADAALDEGAGLEVPATGKAGSSLAISWSGGTDSADQRIAVARPDQPDFSWISAVSATGKHSLEITLPAEPGLYEVRYVDVTGRAVLGRSMIEVEP